MHIQPRPIRLEVRATWQHSIVFIQINFLPGHMTFFLLHPHPHPRFVPFLPYRSPASESQTWQITIICRYKAFREIFERES